MHSMKNTFLAVVLLGASYAVYTVITTPEPGGQDFQAQLDQGTAPAVISDPMDVPELTPSPNLPPAVPPTRQFAPGPELSTPKTEFGNPPETLELKPDPPVIQPTPKPSVPIKQPEITEPKTRPDDAALIDALKQELGNSSTGDLMGGSFVEQPGVAKTQPANPGTIRANPNQFEPAVTPGADPIRPQDNIAEFAPPEPKPLDNEALQTAWNESESLIRNGQFKGALGRLTRFYESANITPDQRKKLMAWLNQLAGKVIYSAEHNMFQAYVTKPGDTLSDLSAQWNVPAQLIYNINKANIDDPNNLAAGTELKVVTGKFSGLIDLSDQTLTLFVKNLYAGQFSIPAVGTVVPGKYKVARKHADLNTQPTFAVILDSGTTIGSHTEMNSNGNSIGLSRRDVADVFSILSADSSVTIRR